MNLYSKAAGYALLNNITSCELEKTKKLNVEDIEDTIVKEPVVVVKFKDGSIYHAKAQEGDTFCAETGFLWCIAKYVFGGSGKANKTVRYWTTKKEKEKEKIKKLEEKRKALDKEKRERERQEKITERKKAEEAREREIEIQKVAFLRALEEYDLLNKLKDQTERGKDID